MAKGSLFPSRGYKLQPCLAKLCAFVQEMSLCEYMKPRIKLQKKQRKKTVEKLSCCRSRVILVQFTDSHLILRRARLKFIAQIKLQIL